MHALSKPSLYEAFIPLLSHPSIKGIQFYHRLLVSFSLSLSSPTSLSLNCSSLSPPVPPLSPFFYLSLSIPPLSPFLHSLSTPSSLSLLLPLSLPSLYTLH